MDNLKSLPLADLPIQKILIHQGLISCIKNQDPIIKTIFTQQNLEKIITYLIRQQRYQTDDSISAKIHYNAMQVLCCQCHLITDLLFNQDKPLIQKLLQFLKNQQEHYLLAGYFSKVIMAITKRIFSPSSKYNKLFCSYIFEKKYLNLTIYHLYSISSIDYIIRWLSLSTIQIDNNNTKINNQYKIYKKQYLINIFSLINKHKLSQDKIQSVCQLFKNLINQQYKNNKINFQLFLLGSDQNIIRQILEIGQLTQIGLGKIYLLKVLLKRLKQAQKKKDQFIEQKNLYQIVQVQQLQGIFYWLLLSIRTYHDNSNQKKSNRLLLAILQLLELLQQIQSIKDIINTYYAQHCQQLTALTILTMKTNNNLIQLIQSKIIVYVLNDLKCLEFGKRLLLDGIVQVADIQGIRQHVLQWISIVLDDPSEKERIFQNQLQQAQWEHAKQLLSLQKSIQIGDYKLAPSTLFFCYSQQKAKLVFSQFLSTPPTIIYNEKLPSLIKPQLKKIQSTPQALNQHLSLTKKNTTEQHSNLQNHKILIQKLQKIQINELKFENEIINQRWDKYIQYKVQDIIKQMQ